MKRICQVERWKERVACRSRGSSEGCTTACVPDRPCPIYSSKTSIIHYYFLYVLDNCDSSFKSSADSILFWFNYILSSLEDTYPNILQGYQTIKSRGCRYEVVGQINCIQLALSPWTTPIIHTNADMPVSSVIPLYARYNSSKATSVPSPSDERIRLLWRSSTLRGRLSRPYR